MRPLKKLAIALGAVIACVAPLASQEVILSSVWNPKVGSGAVYQSVNGSFNVEIELSTVASERVGGTTGYWVEMSVLDIKKIEKYLLVSLEGTHMQTLRMVTQRRGEDPVETPAQPPVPNLWEIAKRVGNEEITTPAGRFECEHYRANDGKWEAWFSPEVTPFGLVKTADADGTEMVVVRMITDAKDRITGTPRQAESTPR